MTLFPSTRILIIAMAVLLLLLQYRLWLGSGGIEELVGLKNRFNEQQQKNKVMELQNQQLLYQVKDLKTGISTIEHRARQEFGMIKANETFFLVIEE